MIDTASGSCGFPVHTIYVETNFEGKGIEQSHLFTSQEKPLNVYRLCK